MTRLIGMCTAGLGLLTLSGWANAVPVYLNDQNISVTLGSGMAAEPFNNRTTAASLASVIDAPSADAPEDHNQSTHVWASVPLALDFDFGTEYDLTELHFWNYFSEGFDVDEIDFLFFDSSNSEVGSLLDVVPELGGSGGNPIFAEDYALSFPSNVQFVSAVLTGSNGEVDFNNIGFTGEASVDNNNGDDNGGNGGDGGGNGGPSASVPEPSTLALMVLGLLSLSRFRGKA